MEEYRPQAGDGSRKKAPGIEHRTEKQLGEQVPSTLYQFLIVAGDSSSSHDTRERRQNGEEFLHDFLQM